MTVIIYEVFYFFEGIYFRKPLKSECLILEIYSKYNPVNTRRRFNVDTTSYDVVRRLIDVETTSCVYREPLSNLLNGVLYFSFTSLLKKWAKEKRRWYLSKEQKRKTKYCYHNEICKWKKHQLFHWSWNYKGVLWITVFKKKI